MTAKVLDLHPPTPSPGFLGLIWSYTYDPVIRRHYIDGRAPGASVFAVRFKAEFLPGNAGPADLRAIAQMLNDMPEDAASLMAADFERSDQ